MIDIYSDIFLIFQGYFADQFRFILYAIHAAISLLQLILACLVDKRPSSPDTHENKRVPVVIVCFGYVTALSHGVNSLGRTYGDLPCHLSTPGLRLPSCSLSPHTFCHTSCIRSVPSPVLLSYQVSGLSLSCLSVIHIYLNPTHMNASTLQTPHITEWIYCFQYKRKNGLPKRLPLDTLHTHLLKRPLP